MYFSAGSITLGALLVAAAQASENAATAQPPPFYVIAKVFSTSDCSTPIGTAVQTLNVTGCATAAFDFMGAEITVPKSSRPQAKNYTMEYTNTGGCSSPNRQGYVYTPVPDKPTCQAVGSNFGVSRSVTFLQGPAPF